MLVPGQFERAAALAYVALGAWCSLAGACTARSRQAASSPAPAHPATSVRAREVTADAPSYVFPADRRERLARAFPELQARIERRFEQSRAPGIAFGLMIDGELAFSFVRGFADVAAGRPITARTAFRVGSVTKTFTALAIRKLAQDGVVSLDDALERYVPEASRIVYATSDSEPVRLRDLLTHTSGLPLNGNYDISATSPAPPRESDVERALVGVRAEFATGTDCAYSNFGYALLGVVAAHAARMPFRQYLGRELLEPLGIRDAAWDPESVPSAQRSFSYEQREGRFEIVPPERLGASEADGGLMLSLDDLARWAAFHLEAFPARNDPDRGPVSRATLRDALSAHQATSLAPTWGSEPNRGIAPTAMRVVAKAHGWMFSDDCASERSVWKDGAIDAYVARVQLLPLHGVALFTLANGDFATQAAHSDVLEALRRTGGLVPRQARPAPALVRAAQAWLELRARWSERGFSALYNEYFRASVDRRAQHAWSAKSVAELGACSLGAPELVYSSRHARFAVSCERGEGSLTLRLDGYSERIALVASDWRYSPSTELVTRGKAIVAELGRTGADSTALLGAGAFEHVPRARAELAECGSDRVEALPSAGPELVTLRLQCRSTAELRIELHFGAGRVDRLDVARLLPVAERCPGF